MKKLLLISSLFLAITSAKAQTINCGNFCILGMTIDTAHDELNVTIYNGDTNSVNYPTVRVVDAIGDTVGNINGYFYFFAQLPGDTVIHTIPTTLTSLPPGFTGTIYLTDGIFSTTCSFNYPMSCTVGVPELAAANSISVYPNPATDNVTVDLTELNKSNAQITISDVTGKLIRSYTAFSNQLIINRDGLESGMYFIFVVTDNKRYTNKLIIK